MRVLVTGSAGVVGRAVRRALSADHELILLDRWDQECDDGVWSRPDQPPPGASGPPLGAIGPEATIRTRDL